MRAPSLYGMRTDTPIEPRNRRTEIRRAGGAGGNRADTRVDSTRGRTGSQEGQPAHGDPAHGDLNRQFSWSRAAKEIIIIIIMAIVWEGICFEFGMSWTSGGQSLSSAGWNWMWL